jgi:uncharacterized protein
MLFLLSPAKSLDYETPSHVSALTTPFFAARSAQLIDLLKTKSVSDIRALMNLSEPLAVLNVERYGAWSSQFTAQNSKPAVLAFSGDVYEGLQASSLSQEDLQWAQNHVAILSGLYGLLRPLDHLQPYRLEMGTALPNAQGKNLYEFWGDALAAHLNQALAHDKKPVIVNLASQEYFKAVDRVCLQPQVVDCVFEDWKNDRYKVISFFAKRARGLMVRYAIAKRISRVQQLQLFNAEGYVFDAAASRAKRLVFRRRLVDSLE